MYKTSRLASPKAGNRSPSFSFSSFCVLSIPPDRLTTDRAPAPLFVSLVSRALLASGHFLHPLRFPFARSRTFGIAALFSFSLFLPNSPLDLHQFSSFQYVRCIHDPIQQVISFLGVKGIDEGYEGIWVVGWQGFRVRRYSLFPFHCSDHRFLLLSLPLEPVQPDFDFLRIPPVSFGSRGKISFPPRLPSPVNTASTFIASGSRCSRNFFYSDIRLPPVQGSPISPRVYVWTTCSSRRRATPSTLNRSSSRSGSGHSKLLQAHIWYRVR